MMVVGKHKRKFEWWKIGALGIFPFLKLGQGIRWLWDTIFFDKIRIGKDEAFGSPIYYSSIFSWSKGSFVLAVITFIIVIIRILD
jgi:hypothetical protein